LSVQNANISKPNCKHAQSAWHRDLPYQNFTTSKPLAINFLVVVDDFTHENGGVVVLPFSHRMEDLPSQAYLVKHSVVITAKAGDVIVFDSMLMHRTGVNLSNQDRISFNHMYTRPFIKQQYDYADLMKNMVHGNKRAYQLSGISSRTASDDVDWRMIRKEKIQIQTA
jgi:ectoine hydroxylase-related dioxygenase (phytanoyl-CoA dioxygenase family)